MAFNTHSRARGSGLVQHVFRSPARPSAPAEAHGGPCAAPPSEKRFLFKRKTLSVIMRDIGPARAGAPVVVPRPFPISGWPAPGELCRALPLPGRFNTDK